MSISRMKENNFFCYLNVARLLSSLFGHVTSLERQRQELITQIISE